jgi:hypothetical protein
MFSQSMKSPSEEPGPRPTSCQPSAPGHKLLGTDEWFVIHHMDCGMETFTDEVMRALLRQSLDTAEPGADGWHDVGRGPGSSEGDFIDWLNIESQTESVIFDVRRIGSHPLVPGSVAIYGYFYDLKNGIRRRRKCDHFRSSKTERMDKGEFTFVCDGYIQQNGRCGRLVPSWRLIAKARQRSSLVHRGDRAIKPQAVRHRGEAASCKRSF